LEDLDYLISLRLQLMTARHFPSYIEKTKIIQQNKKDVLFVLQE